MQLGFYWKLLQNAQKELGQVAEFPRLSDPMGELE